MIDKIIQIVIDKRQNPHNDYIDLLDRKLLQHKDELQCIVNALVKEKAYMGQYLYIPSKEEAERIKSEIQQNWIDNDTHLLHPYIMRVINELQDPYGEEKDDNGYSALDIAIMDNPAIDIIGDLISTFWLLQFDFIQINREADRQKYIYAFETLQEIDQTISVKDSILKTGGITKDKIIRSSFFSNTRILNKIDGLSNNQKSKIANELLQNVFDYQKNHKITDTIKCIDYLELNTLYYYA